MNTKNRTTLPKKRTWAITAAVLLMSPILSRILKQKGSMAVERLMGMLLVMIAVQMFLNGLKHYMQS